MDNIRKNTDHWQFVGKYDDIILDGYIAERVRYFLQHGWKIKGLKRTHKLWKDGVYLSDDQFHNVKLPTF